MDVSLSVLRRPLTVTIITRVSLPVVSKITNFGSLTPQISMTIIQDAGVDILVYCMVSSGALE